MGRMLKRLLIIAFLMSQTACGKVASWYAKGFEGKSTASGYIYMTLDNILVHLIHMILELY